MATVKRAATSKHRADIAHYTRLGYKASEIANVLGIATKTVYNNLAILTELWKEEAINDINEYRMSAVSFIEGVKLESLKEWERSKQTEIVIKRRIVDGEVEYTEETVRDRCGNVQYLSLVVACQEKQLSILGIENLQDPQTRTPHTLDGALNDLDLRLKQLRSRNSGDLN